MTAMTSEDTGNRVYYGWFVTGACFTGAMAVFSVNLSFGVFFEPLLAEFGQSRVDTSVVFSIQAVVLYVSGAVGGGIVDRFGTKRLMFLGTSLYGTGLVITTQVVSIGQMYVSYGLITGVGMGIIYVISYTTVSRWFERRRGVATGIATAGTGIGASLLPLVANLLLTQYSWQEAYFIVTVVMVGLLLLATAVIYDSPESINADTGAEFSADSRPKETNESWNAQYRQLINIVLSAPFLLVFVAIVTAFLPVYTLFVHLVVYVEDIGLSSWIGVGSISLISGATIPGRIAIGKIGDRVGRTRIFVLCTAMMAVLVIGLPIVGNPTLLLLFSLVYGIFYGGAAALFAPLIIDYFGTANVNAKFGTMAIALGIGAVSGPILAGLAYDAFGNYTVMFIVSGAFGLLSPLLIIIVEKIQI